MSAGYCTVVYDGRGQPEHLAGVYRFKGVEFESGKEIEVDAARAGHLLATAPPGSVKLVSGTPIPWEPGTPLAKLAAKQAAKAAERVHLDGADALDNVRTIPKAIRDVLSKGGADAIALVESGKADERLGDVAVWAQLSGLGELAKAAARRAVKVATKGGASP